jgi:hypothetical protein
MRHFLRLALPPCLLTGGVLARATPTLLVALPSKAQRVAPCLLHTPPSAVAIAVITIAADRHGTLAAVALILSILLLAHTPPEWPQWTNSGSARITNSRTALLAHRN